MRFAFTMIELIFVIVVLGILATIALPKFGSLEDDALIAKERAAIGAARSAVVAMQARAKLTSGESFKHEVEIFSNDPTVHGNKVTIDITKGTHTHSVSQFPLFLSVNAYTTGGVPTQASGSVAGDGMALVLGADNRNEWATKQAAVATMTKIQGPATKAIKANSAQYSQAGSWIYNPVTGRFNYDANQSF